MLFKIFLVLVALLFAINIIESIMKPTRSYYFNLFMILASGFCVVIALFLLLGIIVVSI